ncbi:zeta toxin family protein [Andreprevotia chitinilytica]|uniref:zeta toxin family protein n=1 Tax=Andreprevotia chitinilytica TaxID=396808 RepID=UPI0005592DC1|nr:zeta toxin family protein [Andreprevotia chitinilytica]
MTERPRLIVVAGPNGSGKTSITEQILRHQWFDGCVYVNPDLIARDEYGDWNAPDAILKAAQRAQAIREECLHARRSLAFETVFSAPDKLDFLQAAHHAGFFIRIFFVGTDHPAINASRVAHRVLEGGHDVPIPKIISRYARSIAQCGPAALLADRCYVYDNSVDRADPHLIFRTVNGAIVKTYGDIRAWAQPLFDSLPHAAE